MIPLLIGTIVTVAAGVALWGASKMDDASGRKAIAVLFLTAGAWFVVISNLIIGSILSIWFPVGGWFAATIIVTSGVFLFLKHKF
jgi:hypothetical protein